jgi:hypothetical protein
VERCVLAMENTNIVISFAKNDYRMIEEAAQQEGFAMMVMPYVANIILKHSSTVIHPDVKAKTVSCPD